MTQHGATIRNDERLGAVIERLSVALNELVYDLGVTDDELQSACAYLDDISRAGETFLFAEVLGLSTAADNVTNDMASHGGTPSNIVGPFYRDDPPLLQSPYVLPRPVDRGPSLLFRGRIADAKSGDYLDGATVDAWQADADGVYDMQRHPDGGTSYLRGVFSAGGNGTFELSTELPGAYEIPKDGPVGKLLARSGRTAFRPKHLHFRIAVEGYQRLTTQVYLEGDEWLGSDVLGAVKPALVAPLEQSDNAETGHDYVASYTFELVRRDDATDRTEATH